jgi:hypothetical protein
MATNEAKFKAKLKESFKVKYSNGVWLSFVANMMQTSGVPDVRIAADGKQAWIEAKVDDNGLEKSQKGLLPLMAKNGERVIVIHTDMRIPNSQRNINVRVFDYTGTLREKADVSWGLMTSGCLWEAILGFV